VHAQMPSLPTGWHQARAHHCLPSSEQRDGKSVCTGKSRMPCVHVMLVQCGTLIYPTCGTQGGFGCVLSRAGQWVSTLHSSSLGSYCTCPIPTCRHAAAAHARSILRGSRHHDAGTFSPGGSRVQASWWPAETSGGLICRPLPDGLQRGQDIHNPGGPKAGDRLREPPKGSHRPWPSISFRGHPLWPTSQEARAPTI
jgi:hypothetical protein